MGVKIKVGNSLEVRNPASGCTASYIHQETTWMRVCCGFIVCSIGLWLGCQPPVPGIRSPGDHALELQPILNYNRDLFASCGRNCPRNFSYHDSCWEPFLGVTDQPNQVSSNKNLAPATTNLKSVNTSVSSVCQRALDGAGRLSPGSQGESVDPHYDTIYLHGIERRSQLIAGNNSHATPIKLTGTKYKLQKIGVPSLSDKEIVAITCTLGAAALSGVVLLLVFLHCRNQQRIRDQHKAFLISIESPIPDVPITDPLRAISQEGQNAIEMATMNPEPRVQPAE